MRKHFFLPIAIASALLVVAPMATAEAATTHVLTIGKKGGKAVRPGAVLKAGLATGTHATFTVKLGTLTCKSAAVSAKVRSNPLRPGKATASLTALSVTKCSIPIKGVKIGPIHTQNLPYKVTISDAKGLPVTISGQSATKPLKFTATATAGTVKVTCTYTAASIKGSFSNAGNTITFKAQKFTKKSGGSFCGKTATFSAKFGAVRDFSVALHPRVFVN